MPRHKITLSDETNFYLDYLCDKEHITAGNRRSVVIQRLIHDQIIKMKIADRPVFEGGKTE